MTGYVRKTRDVPNVQGNRQDWPAVIRSLNSAGVPKARIATATGMTRDILYAVLDGRAEPKWSEGHALVALLNHVEGATP